MGLLAGGIGVTAAGIIGDKCEKRYPRIKGYLSSFGIFSTIPLIGTCYLADNFYLSFFSLVLTNILGELWYGPSFSMINKMFPS